MLFNVWQEELRNLQRLLALEYGFSPTEVCALCAAAIMPVIFIIFQDACAWDTDNSTQEFTATSDTKDTGSGVGDLVSPKVD